MPHPLREADPDRRCGEQSRAQAPSAQRGAGEGDFASELV